MRPEPDLEPINKKLFAQLEKRVELSRLDMSEAELADEFNNCVYHGYDLEEIVMQFEFLLEEYCY